MKHFRLIGACLRRTPLWRTKSAPRSLNYLTPLPLNLTELFVKMLHRVAVGGWQLTCLLPLALQITTRSVSEGRRAGFRRSPRLRSGSGRATHFRGAKGDKRHTNSTCELNEIGDCSLRNLQQTLASLDRSSVYASTSKRSPQHGTQCASCA